MDAVALVIHVGAGSVGLVLLLPVTLARKRRGGWHARTGRVFAVLALAVALTALWLVAQAPGQLLGLGVLGVLTGWWAGAGWALARYRPRVPGGWLRWHITMMGSAAIGFVTAFAVQLTDGHLIAWLAPTLLGSPLIGRANLRWTRGGVRRRPGSATATG